MRLSANFNLHQQMLAGRKENPRQVHFGLLVKEPGSDRQIRRNWYYFIRFFISVLPCTMRRHSPSACAIEHAESHCHRIRCIWLHCRHKCCANYLQNPCYPYLWAVALPYLNGYATEDSCRCNWSETESADTRRDGIRVLARLEIYRHKI